MDQVIVAATILILIVGFGELIGYLTKAAIPSIAVSLITYLLLIWAGMPKTFPATSGIEAFGWFAALLYMVHFATTVAPAEYAKNWRSILIALGAVICGTITTVGIGGLIFGYGTILTGAGAALGGGAMSGIAAIQILAKFDNAALLVLPVLMISAVDPFGQPVCSAILRKYVNKLIKKDAYLHDAHKETETEPRLTKDGVPYGSEDNPSPFIRNFIPKRVESEPILIVETALIALLSIGLESVTGISSLLFAFLLGILACTFGFLRMNILDRAVSSGMVLTVIIAWLFAGENEITPQLVLEGLAPMVGIVVLSAIGLGLGAGLVGKFFKYDFFLCAACGVAIMFIVPGAFMIPNMMTKRLGRDEKEVRFLQEKIMPSMYIIIYSAIIFGLILTMAVFLPVSIKLL
jgi:uncharacterized membrane protein (UPF0136 family)